MNRSEPDPTLERLFRKRPEMFLGTPSPKEEDARDAFVKQLEIQGCNPIRTFISNGWYFVGSPMDWLESGLRSAIDERAVFQRSFPLVEGGQNSVRFEYFLYHFCVNLILWRGNRSITIKGVSTQREIELLRKTFSDGVAIAFSGNTFANPGLAPEPLPKQDA